MEIKKPLFQNELIWRGQGYDCKWDFISNTIDNFLVLVLIMGQWSKNNEMKEM